MKPRICVASYTSALCVLLWLGAAGGSETLVRRDVPEPNLLPAAGEPMRRLAQLRACPPKDVLKTTRKWASEGRSNRALWVTVRLGAAPNEKLETRVRASWLAAELLSRWSFAAPRPYFDPAAVDPLVSCFNAQDARLVTSSADALAMADSAYPDLRIRRKLHKRIVLLLRHHDKDLARAGMVIAMVTDGRFAPEIVGAWKRHAEDSSFAEHCLFKLRALLSLRLQAAVRLKHPDWKATSPKEAWEIGRKIKAEAKPEIEALYAKLGQNSAMWGQYWRDELRNSPSAGGEEREPQDAKNVATPQRDRGFLLILAVVMIGAALVLVLAIIILRRRMSCP
jgi:hypothetical protein